MQRIILSVAVVLFAAIGCDGDGSSILGGFSALESCDYAAQCTQAVARASALKETSPELRARLLHVRMNALMKFPAVDQVFLDSIGMKREEGFGALIPELKALASDSDPQGKVLADQATLVFDFMREPTCTRFMELEALQKGGGLFADSAAIARISGLIQLLSAVTPENSAYVADAMKVTVGCALSSRASGAAVMVAAKTMLGDSLGACPAAGSGDMVLRSLCEQGRTMLGELSLPLPMVESRSGELASAFLPTGRSVGISVNPPWMISLSAGRLMVVDQVVVPPDAMQVPDNQPTLLMDLRETHRQEDIKASLHEVLKTRKVWKRSEDDKSSWIFVVVDRSTTFADLSEVMGAFMAETEAVPLVAVLPSGASRALWMPLNFFVKERPLFAPDGKMSTWIRPAYQSKGIQNAVLELTPFSIRSGDRTVDFQRDAAGSSVRDLRDVNKLAVSLREQGVPDAYQLKVSQAVTFDLLVAVIEALAFRLPDSAMASAGAFASSQELRAGIGTYDYLLGWSVLDRNW